MLRLHGGADLEAGRPPAHRDRALRMARRARPGRPPAAPGLHPDQQVRLRRGVQRLLTAPAASCSPMDREPRIWPAGPAIATAQAPVSSMAMNASSSEASTET